MLCIDFLLNKLSEEKHGKHRLPLRSATLHLGACPGLPATLTSEITQTFSDRNVDVESNVESTIGGVTRAERPSNTRTRTSTVREVAYNWWVNCSRSEWR